LNETASRTPALCQPSGHGCRRSNVAVRGVVDGTPITMRATRVLVLLSLATVLCLGGLSFAVDVEDSRPEPVAFEETVELGLTGAETTQAASGGYAVPRAQVFYSQYQYVAGYQTIGSLVTERRRAGHERQFGRPLATYVTDFSGETPELTATGYIQRSGNAEDWVAAPKASFVVGSRARTPAGPAVVPFSRRADAVAFRSAYGGSVTSWDAVQTRAFERTETAREQGQHRIDNRSAWANETVATARTLSERPVSTIVGRDAPTLPAAIEQAHPNTTVVVPAGTYTLNRSIQVRESITIRGAGTGTVLRGNGTGSLLSVQAPRVAVADLQIRGVGATIVPDSIPAGESSEFVQLNYAYGDAGIVFETANGSSVRNVQIDTPANGLVVRDSDRLVVERLTVRGGETWRSGSMGVLAVGSRIVVQHSTFVDGRDGVYMHLGDGTVARDNRMRSLRYGVHLMYTDRTLVAQNTVTESDTGVIVMTDPAGNAVLDNEVTTSRRGLSVTGAGTYVARNVLVDNTKGLVVLSKRSLYEHNSVLDNEIGVVSSDLLPTNTVLENDIVGNQVPARATLGPLRIWTGHGGGNYWGQIPGRDQDGDGLLDRAYHATGPVDSRAGRVPGASVLAQSPAVTTSRAATRTLPGLTSTGVLDTRPLASPVRPAVMRANRASSDRSGGRS
jgi:nitrous oxidase accessory protein NosD/nitrous oxide reductase accessory protein NosL